MNKLYSYFALFVASVFFSQSAHAGLVFGDGSAQVAYGQQYTNTVLSFQVQDELGVWSPFGSAVVIDKNANGQIAFLAADHSIIKNSGDPSSRFSAYRVGVGNYFSGETKFVDEFILHPNANGTINGFSYGLGFVDDPFLSANLAPASFYNGTVMVGQDSDIAGYGVLQQVNTSVQTFTGDLRAGNNVISGVNGLGLGYYNTRFEPDGRPIYRPLGMGGTEFDSGGGLFINGQRAGLTTSSSGNPNFSSFTGYNPIDFDWVNNTIAGRATAVPEPSSVILMTVGSLFLAGRRRRRIS